METFKAQKAEREAMKENTKEIANNSQLSKSDITNSIIKKVTHPNR